MKKVKKIVWTLGAFGIVALAATGCAHAPVTEKLTFYKGDEIANAKNVTLDENGFNVPDAVRVEREEVQQIEFAFTAHDGESKTESGAASGLSELAQSMLERGAAAMQKHPGVPGVILVDDGVFVYRSNGTSLYRYHFAGLVLKEDMKSWGHLVTGFTEGRSRVRILFARAAAPDGTMTSLNSDDVEISSPSEEMQFFNPTRKVLSGVIPGVEVGSVVEYEYEVETYNPEDPRLFFPGYAFQSTEPVVYSRVRVEVPSSVPFQYMTRQFPEGMNTEPVIDEKGGVRAYTWTVEDMPPLPVEPMMPPESDLVPVMEGSIFKDFAEAFALVRGLQEARIKRTPAIEAKAAEITAGAETLDEKVARIYHWVQKNTHYISIKGSLGAGWSGHTAQETFESGFGDCTDKAILFTTLLQCIGVTAYPIILTTNDAGRGITEIPTIAGNHAITEIVLDGRSFYLDSTAEDYRYPYFRMDDHGAVCFNAIRGEFGVIPVPPPEDNARKSQLDVVLEADGNLTVTTKNSYTGSIEAGIRAFWSHTREDNRKPRMAEYVNSISPGAELKNFTLSKLEDLSQPVIMTLDYALPHHAIRTKDLMYLHFPTVEREYPEVALETRQFPIQYMTTELRELEIAMKLPPGFNVKWTPAPLEFKSPYLEFRAEYEKKDGQLVYRERFARLQRMIPVEEYPAYRDALRTIAAFSKQEVFLTKEG